MDTQKKLYVSILVLAGMGGALYLQNKKQHAEAERHSISGAQAELPQLGLTDEAVKKVTKIVIQRTNKPGDKAEEGAEGSEGAAGSAPTGNEVREEYTLERKGDEAWDLSKPMTAKANANNVKAMLDNLVKLKLSEQISTSADAYAEWGLTDEKALHAVFYEGDKVVADLYIGDSGSRGQMTRLGGKTGVFAAKGFSKWVYDRDLKGWRDRSVWSFDDKSVTKVAIDNELGKIELKKDGEKWSGSEQPKKGAAGAIKDFKESTVQNLLSAYKALNAVDFATGKTAAETGLEKPVATVSFELKDGNKFDLEFGNLEASNRWVRRKGSDETVSISSWAADWVIKGVEKFQDKKDAPAAGSAAPEPPGMPPGMPPMPAGHP
ncbi:MAG TPA: DUF4340 domain-containing protein [Polyangiaceae bacterium]|nr:DUF4340 domain-containing protein [Polyangiaceae bacterium]